MTDSELRSVQLVKAEMASLYDAETLIKHASMSSLAVTERFQRELETIRKNPELHKDMRCIAADICTITEALLRVSGQITDINDKYGTDF